MERQKDLGVAPLPSPISCSEPSALVRLPVNGSRETESEAIGGGGGGEIRLPAKNRNNGAPAAGFVGEREGSPMDASQGMSCTGVLWGRRAAGRGADPKRRT
jgi:hypothetical protein